MDYPVFHLPIKLYFQDTDMMGIVYHANYLTYFERARTEWFREAGFGFVALAQEGIGFVIGKADIQWISPLSVDDAIVATAQVKNLGNSSMVLEQTVQSDGIVVCRADILMVCVDMASKKPIRLPDNIRVLFETGN